MIEITAARKNSILVESPVLFAAGFAGYDGAPYRGLLALDQFGALVTTPLTLQPRFPANGVRVVPMTAGFLLHTGLPNLGVSRTIQKYEAKWQRSVLPIIVHLAAGTPEDMERAAAKVDRSDAVAGIEIGFPDDITMREMRDILIAANWNTDLPILARLPLYNALMLSDIAQQNHASALVVTAPPRGTERAPDAAKLIGGRIYGPWLKAQALRIVGRIAQHAEVPVIGVGGIQTVEDARDFISAGATAIQLDTIVWRDPKTAEAIARDLGGGDLTRTSRAVIDEEERGDTQYQVRQPTQLPEMPPEDEDGTSEAQIFLDYLEDDEDFR